MNTKQEREYLREQLVLADRFDCHKDAIKIMEKMMKLRKEELKNVENNS